jgi:hypothetical protein
MSKNDFTLKHNYDDGDVFLSIPTPKVITPDIRYEMRNSVKSVDLQMDGNIVEYPVIFTFSCFGIRVPGDSAFVRKLLEPKTDKPAEVLKVNWKETFDESSIVSLTADASHPPEPEDYCDGSDSDGNDNDSDSDDNDVHFDEEPLRWNCEDSIFEMLTDGEEEVFLTLYHRRTQESLVYDSLTGPRIDYDYESDVMEQYYGNYLIRCEDTEANKVFITPATAVYDTLIIPHMCMGAEQEYDKERKCLRYVRRVYHKKLDVYGYWIDKKRNAKIVSQLQATGTR